MPANASRTAPRILIDGYFLDRPNGFGRYVRELILAVAPAGLGCAITVAVTGPVDADLAACTPHVRYRALPNAPLPLWEQIILPVFAAATRPDLVHYPYNTRSVIAPRPTVTTVHDLTFLDKGAERDARSALIHLYSTLAFQLGAVRSDRIIAVSDTTARALLARGVRSQRIYNTVDSFLEIQPAPDGPGSERPFFLHRGGSAAGHRNTPRVIEAFLGTAALRDRFELRILGVPDGAARWRIAEGEPVRFLARVSDAELARLYSQAVALVAPSILEGFCLPIIEGFGFGAPVITSDIDPMREIADGAALLVSPERSQDIAQAMLQVSSDHGLARDLVRRGRERLQTFTSAKMGAALASLYRDAVAVRPQPAGAEARGAEA